jgi:hypothetical protein
MKIKNSSNKNKVVIILGFNLHRHGHLASSYNDDCRFAASTLLSTCLCFFLLCFIPFYYDKEDINNELVMDFKGKSGKTDK